MGDDAFRIMELSLQGFNCSQILMLLALEARGQTDPDLVRSMTGLLTGLGAGKLCGALTGGCCVLGLVAGKASARDEANPRFAAMLSSFVEWFEERYSKEYGGINCSDIVRDDARLRLERCPMIVAETQERLAQVLAENGLGFDGASREKEG